MQPLIPVPHSPSRESSLAIAPEEKLARAREILTDIGDRLRAEQARRLTSGVHPVDLVALVRPGEFKILRRDELHVTNPKLVPIVEREHAAEDYPSAVMLAVVQVDEQAVFVPIVSTVSHLS
jgi:hypothetical protein